ncbi:MAG TPA: SCO family protein [Candidatus Angelobacter sp.]
MRDISRRKFLSFGAAAPLASAVLSRSAVAASAQGAKVWPASTQETARQRLQRLHLPNLPLINHEGKRVLFYDDLVKDKVVSLNFFFAKCGEICPLVMTNLAKVQKILGDQVGRDIFMYSFTLKPEEDSVAVLKQQHEIYGVGPGWTFLTGKPDDMENLRRAIGFAYPEPAIDKDKTQHIGNIRFGNEPLMYWSACPGMAHAKWVAETLEYIIHPDRPRIQPS